MKKPAKGGKGTKAKDRSGVNKPVVKAKVPQVTAENKYGKIAQKAKS